MTARPAVRAPRELTVYDKCDTEKNVINYMWTTQTKTKSATRGTHIHTHTHIIYIIHTSIRIHIYIYYILNTAMEMAVKAESDSQGLRDGGGGGGRGTLAFSRFIAWKNGKHAGRVQPAQLKYRTCPKSPVSFGFALCLSVSLSLV